MNTREQVIDSAIGAMLTGIGAQVDSSRRIAKLISSNICPAQTPKAGESSAVALANPKSAALIYDRVWSGLEIIPEPIGFFGESEDELKAASVVRVFQSITDTPASSTESEISELIASGLGLASTQELSIFKSLLSQGVTELGMLSPRYISEAIRSRSGVAATPIYYSMSERDQEYREGNYQVLIATLSDLEVVDEESLEWGHVLEFRADKDARIKLRRLFHWLDKEMIGKTDSYICDEIAVRLEDYRWAIKKHGLKTTVGVLSRTLDYKMFLANATTYGAFHWAGNDIGGLVAAGGTFMANAALQIAKAKIEEADVRRARNPEISYVYELERSFKDGR